MGQKAHFCDISYNVFNRRKSSYFVIKPLDFTISCRMDQFNESHHQKLIFFVYFLNTCIYKKNSLLVLLSIEAKPTISVISSIDCNSQPCFHHLKHFHLIEESLAC